MSVRSHAARLRGSPFGLASSGAAAAPLSFARTYAWSFPVALLAPRCCAGRGLGGSVETRDSTRAFLWSWPALELSRVADSVLEACGQASPAPGHRLSSQSVWEVILMGRGEAWMFCPRPNRAGILQLYLHLLTRKRRGMLRSPGDAILPPLTSQS